MIVISDTSVISGLLRVGRLGLLPALFGRVCIPPQVRDELLRLADFGYDTSFLASDWLYVVLFQNEALYSQLLKDLDEGESAAIALAIEMSADWLLIDEAAGRETARALGVRIIGTLGVLTEAKRRGLLPLIRPVLDDLILKAGFRVRASLYQTVLRDNGE